MIHAYAETYLNDAMSNLGEAFDYAVNACNLSPDRFMELFIASGFADKFGKGNPKVVSGTCYGSARKQRPYRAISGGSDRL